MTTETGAFTPTDEDVERAARALHIEAARTQTCRECDHLWPCPSLEALERA